MRTSFDRICNLPFVSPFMPSLFSVTDSSCSRSFAFVHKMTVEKKDTLSWHLFCGLGCLPGCIVYARRDATCLKSKHKNVEFNFLNVTDIINTSTQGLFRRLRIKTPILDLHSDGALIAL